MTTTTLEVEDEKDAVEYLIQLKVQNLDIQVNLESQGGLLVVTIRCQIVKGICKVDSEVLLQ